MANAKPQADARLVGAAEERLAAAKELHAAKEKFRVANLELEQAKARHDAAVTYHRRVEWELATGTTPQRRLKPARAAA